MEVTNNGHPPESRWQHPFDAAVKDVFAVQSDIAGRVANAMQVAIGDAAQARLAKVPTHDAAAYDAYLRGQASQSVRASILAHCAARSRRSRMRSGTTARWWSPGRRCRHRRVISISGSTPSPSLARKALAAAERAIALDSTRWEGYDALAHYHLTDQTRLRPGCNSIARARQLAPQAIGPRATAARLEAERGDLEAAVRDLAETTRLDPRNVEVWFGSAIRRCFDCIGYRKRARRLRERSPSHLGNIAAI